MKFVFINLLFWGAISATGQAKLVINGGIITIHNGAILVIDNPDNAAITQTGSGYIVSEAENNRVIWSVGPGNGNVYLLPFGNASGYLPVSFSAASGSAAGQIIFSTYPTATWKNSDDLPADVTNVNSGSTDNSAKLVDRFWQINPQGYANKPNLQNLSFTYSKTELQSPNTIVETDLIAQRWNNVSASWSDYTPTSLINTSNSTVTVTSITGSELFDWWTLVDASQPLPITLQHYRANAQAGTVVNIWQTAMESNTSHFEVWRSQDLSRFDEVGTVPAAGNSENTLSYKFIDYKPYSGISYYRLRSVDLDGKLTWSEIAKVIIDNSAAVSIYPNPANFTITLSVPGEIAAAKTTADLYDMAGRKVQTFLISSPIQDINISGLSSGTYHIYFIWKQNPVRVDFIKN